MIDLSGRTALVTGSSRGMGRAMAELFAELGARVAIHCKRNEEAAAEVAAGIAARGGAAFAVQADLEEPEAIGRLFDGIAERCGGLDILVLNAGATAFRETLALKEHHIDRTFGLNVKGNILCVQRAVPLMKGRAGRILFISGYGSIRCLPGYGAMGSAKAAMETWTRYLAVELAPRGITVNGINPGYVVTDSSRVYFSQDGVESPDGVIRRTPLGRPCSPRDVASLAAFLASDAAAFITGQTILIDGGLTLLSPPHRLPEALDR